MGNPFAQFTESFKKGEMIFREGEVGSEMFVVHSGEVEIVKRIGDKEETLAIMEKGDFFGEMALLEGLPRTADAKAHVDSDVIRINGAVFDKMIKANIEIAVRMMRKLSVRVREANERLENIMMTSDEAPRSKPPAAEQELGGVQAFLTVNPAGTRHPITAAQVTVGRFDPVTGIKPDIDLTKEEMGRSVSRRHAKIIYSDGTFYLAEEIGTLNNTAVNSKRVETGVLTPLQEGDLITLGGVEATFHIA